MFQCSQKNKKSNLKIKSKKKKIIIMILYKSNKYIFNLISIDNLLLLLIILSKNNRLHKINKPI